MDSMVFESIWLILVILRLRTMQNYLTPKQGSASSNTKETPTREGNEPSACIYMDCIIYSKPSSPCVQADRCGWELCIGSAPVAYLSMRG